MIKFILIIIAIQTVASSIEPYKDTKTSYGGVNDNGDIGVRGSDGLLRQDGLNYYGYPNSIKPLGGVNNNGNIGVRGNDGSIRQGDTRYASAYGDGNYVTKKTTKKDQLKNRKNFKTEK